MVAARYRRGAATCGDIDVLIAADSAAEINLEEIVRELKRLGVVSEDLTLSNKMNKSADAWVDQTGFVLFIRVVFQHVCAVFCVLCCEHR